MQKALILGWRDFLTKEFLAITFLPFILTLLLLGGGWIAFGGNIVDTLLRSHIHNHLLHSIVTFLANALGFFVAVLLSTSFATIIMGFFTPYVVRKIHKRHYSHIPLQGGVGIGEYLWILAKTLLKFLFVFLLSLLLFFIPLLNAIALNIPFYYLFSSLLTLDVGGEIYTKKELEAILKKRRLTIASTTGVLYLITLLPFAGSLLQVYFVSVMAHLFFGFKNQ